MLTLKPLAATNTLTGWALLSALPFSDSPTSGQFAFTNSSANKPPYVNLQPVQGFSGVLAGPRAATRCWSTRASATATRLKGPLDFQSFSASAGNANEPKRLVFSAFKLIILSSSWVMIGID